ncbi:MAG TPA: DsbA family protein [Polyangia bacterium]
MIDAALARARDLMRERGLARGQVYAEVQRDALDKAEGTPLAPPAYRREPDLSATYQIPVGSSPVRGAATALITIVAFMDYQCPYCGRAEATLADLRTRFGKDLRIVCKHNPLAFHSHAALAAEAALAARAQGRFWQMHDKLFANQAALERADLERYATEIGLDLRRFRAALDARTYKAAVEADQQLAQRFGARGTPTFYVNGRVLLGAQPLDAFVQSCEDARARARALAAKRRIRPERLYEELTRDGLMRLAPPGSGEDARVPVPVSGRRRLPQRRGAFGAGRSRSRSNARRRRRASAPP